jgi:IclR family transcriptional regulator, KDG regulon repressor
MARGDGAATPPRKQERDLNPEGTAGGGGQGLQLLDRAIRLIFILRNYDRKVSLQELATALEISKSAVYRLLGTLSRLELVARDNTGRYQIGSKMKELSADLWTDADVRVVALPFMEQLRDICGETVSLHVLDGVTHVVVEQCASPHEVQWVRRVGHVYTVLSGANACAFLASFPAAEAKAILAKTRSSAESGPSARELQDVRRLGYALYERGGPVDGFAIAAPIFTRSGKPIATLCVSGPSPRFGKKAAEKISSALLERTTAISKAMGYRDPREGIA